MTLKFEKLELWLNLESKSDCCVNVFSHVCKKKKTFHCAPIFFSRELCIQNFQCALNIYLGTYLLKFYWLLLLKFPVYINKEFLYFIQYISYYHNKNI